MKKRKTYLSITTTDLLARADNFLNHDSDESDPDRMAVEYFRKLHNQVLPQVEIERNED